jgi:hypothetical protein
MLFPISIFVTKSLGILSQQLQINRAIKFRLTRHEFEAAKKQKAGYRAAAWTNNFPSRWRRFTAL